MADLFISYASEDRDTVEVLVREFESQGWTVWWDRHIEIGSSFDERIEEAIEAALCIVVVWSRHSVRSEWVRAEAAEGLQRNILVPVLLDEVKPPLLFRQKQAISLIDWRADRDGTGDLGKLVPSISAILEGYRRSSLPVSTQRSWVLGQTLSDEDLAEAAHASYLALTLGLSYFENLFIYASAFRGKSTHALDLDQLASLVTEEGLDGYLYGHIERKDDALVFQIRMKQSQRESNEETLSAIDIPDLTSLPVAVGNCLLQCSEALQGSSFGNATQMLDYLQARNTESLNQVFLSRQYSDDNDYAKVRESCLKAIELDDSFSLAYSGLATACQYLGRRAESREAIAKAIGHTENLSRRNSFHARGAYYAMYSEDHEKAAAEWESLIQISPLDESALNNLAVCYFYQLQFDRSREISARDLALYPMKKIGLQNSAFYSLYAGEFSEADRQAQTLLAEDSNYINALVVRALASAERGDESGADELYVAAAGDAGRKDAVVLQGRSDIAMARGDWAAAEEFLLRGSALDRELGNHEYAARKLLMMAEIAFSTNRPAAEGLAHVNDALNLSTTTETLASAAFICIRFDIPAPDEIESGLKLKVSSHGRAYTRMISGYAACRDGDLGSAVQHLDDALKIADLWLIRFGRAYLFQRAGLHLETMDEISRCLARPGEAVSAALDEQPTYRLLALARRFGK